MKIACDSDSRVLITGIDGFTGRHLAAYLQTKGYDVYGTTRHKDDHARHFACDITDAKAIERIIRDLEPHYVIHLAAIAFVAHEDRLPFYAVNVIGSENLLMALDRSSHPIKKVILASSAAVYGDQKSEILDESMSPRPINHYGCSKWAMERIAHGYFDRLPIIITRPFNYTGAGQSQSFLVPKLTCAFGQKAPFVTLGNLHVAREFNDVHFACEAYARLLTTDRSAQIFNIASGRAIALRTIIDLLETISHHRLEIRQDPHLMRPNEIPRLVGSPQRLFEAIGPIEQPPFETTLRQMMAEPCADY